jgi:hypothetical protein
MEEKTSKIKRLISFTDKQWDMLRAIMDADGLTSYSVAIGNLIAVESKRRNPLYMVNEDLPIIKIK